MAAGPGHNRKAELQSLLERAKTEVFTFGDQLAVAIEGTRAQQLSALGSIYRFYVAVSRMSDGGVEFLSERGITPNPRAKYAAQPLVRHLTSGADRDLRVKASFWAGAIAWADRNGVGPEDFQAFIENCEGGIDGAYRMEVAARKGKVERGRVIDRLLEAIKAYRDSEPPEMIPQISHLKGAPAGKHLVIVEVDEGGSASIVALLRRSPDQVERTFDDHVLAWKTEKRG